MSRTRVRQSIQWPKRNPTSLARCVALILLAAFSPLALLADGCFVFKWNKSIDINEPTQKAIIVYDAGREDLLLQVKYEGPLDEFGWLIPVPSLPKVEKGSMEPFYELSQLTQSHFGIARGAVTMSAPLASLGEEKVKVIETKTVGAYEVAVLSAKDTGSLAKWLQTHDYSLPEGKSDIIDDYIRRGWFFIAAKIDLKKGVGFKSAPGNARNPANNSRQSIKAKLSSGELHPLLISFDTPECIFPLKISAVGGRPSEVSLYVLSTQPLLNPFIFGKAVAKLEESHANWLALKSGNTDKRLTSMRNTRALQLAYQMYAADRTSRTTKPRRNPDWKLEDLEAMAAEALPSAESSELRDEHFYSDPAALLQCLPITPDKLPKSVKGFPRIKDRNWYLTKQVWTFVPADMNDLQFVPAIPALAELLAHPAGKVAAQILARFGSNAIPDLVVACSSANSVERVNAVWGFEQMRDQKLADPLAKLLHDATPRVRLHAVQAAEANWDARLTDDMMSLLRDTYTEIRQQAAACLSARENSSRTPAYLALLTDADPNVRAAALGIAWSINRRNPSPEVQSAALRSLRDTNLDVQSHALHTLWKMDHSAIPRADLMPLLCSSNPTTIFMAVKLIEGTGLVRPAVPEPEAAAREAALRERQLSSAELEVLATNRLGQVRFMTLRLLERNGDAKAVELILPLLRDTNSVVRSQAFGSLRNIADQNISDDDPNKWDAWWTANKATFKPKL
ncbi:MAG TPA: DUF2330 domain-containing protein [Verrucomicrobiae bacterium]|nr:DUF2330 domain-containing protein [Verrucomicrobiae bacterium]